MRWVKPGSLWMRWLLSQFPLAFQVFTNEFFTIIAQRQGFFLPACLWGEALVIEGVACSFDVHVDRFDLANDLENPQVRTKANTGV